MTDDPQVDAYLRQLDNALSPLPWQQRQEVLTDITEHLQRALSGTSGSRSDVEAALLRLGDPREIAAAAGAAPVPVPERGRGLEIAAIILLAVGGFAVPFVGWFVGVGLLWASRRFTRTDKLIGTLAPPFGYAALLLVLLFPAASSSTSECRSNLSDTGLTQQTCTSTMSTHTFPGALALLTVIVLLAAPTYTLIRLIRATARPTRAS